MYYIGVDYHKRYSYLVIKDEQGKLIEKGSILNSREDYEVFLRPYTPGKAVLEATRCWSLAYDWLEEMVDDVVLGHPQKMRAIAEARIKTDKISADIMADLLRADLIPAAYAPGKETREAKNILRQRMFLVRLRTMVKNRIHDILDRHPEIKHDRPEVTDLFGAVGMKWLRQVRIEGTDNAVLAGEIDLLDAIRGKISASDGMIKELAKGDKLVLLLKTVPGIGDFFSVLVRYEIDDIGRFRDAKKLCSYAGLVPSTHASGGKVFNGRITKRGNKWLRWAMVEAVNPAIRADAELNEYYQGIKRRKGRNAAKVATARRLLTIVHKVMSEQRPFIKRPGKSTKHANPAALTSP